MSLVITDNNRVPDILREIEYLNNHEVQIGVFGADDSHMVMIASVNEFGCDITVTNKMRNYLHSQGLHLKKDTTKIKIPERSFIRSAFDENVNKIKQYSETLLAKVLNGQITGRTYLERLGEFAKNKVQKKIRDVNNPANHPFTQEKKGANNPLIDSGRLRQSIAYKVVSR